MTKRRGLPSPDWDELPDDHTDALNDFEDKGGKPVAKLNTGLGSGDAQELHVFHHPNGNTYVASLGEHQNAMPWGWKGHKNPKHVLKEYLKMMKEEGGDGQYAEGGTAHQRTDKKRRKAS